MRTLKHIDPIILTIYYLIQIPQRLIKEVIIIIYDFVLDVQVWINYITSLSKHIC